MKMRRWRRAGSIACSVAFVLGLLLLARSYWRLDVIAFKVSKARAAFVASQLGRIYVGIDGATNKTGYVTRAVPASGRGKQSLEDRTGFGGAVGDGNTSYIMVPHWFVLLLIVTLAGCVQLGGRFSVRVMLLVLPLVALVLVLLACLHILGVALPREH